MERHSRELLASLGRGIRLRRNSRIIDRVEPPTTSLWAQFVGDPSNTLARQSLLVAAVCLLADAAGFFTVASVSQFRALDWAVFAAVVVVDAALALPARHSGWVALAHAVVRFTSAALLGGSTLGGQANDAGSLIAGYRAGAWLRGGAAAAALAVLSLGIGGSSLFSREHGGDAALLVEVVKNALLPWLVGRYTTARRAHIAELEQRAENQRRDAQAAVQQAVAEERSAFARDLHDVISHHVSAIGVHAGAARLGLSTAASADGIADSLAAVETASRSAMADLRRLLDLLHGDGSDTSRQPGLDNIEELLDGVRRAGLPTKLSTYGSGRPLPGSLDVALYRITQEMLTNALRHGDGSAVEVELRYHEASVSLTARNGIPAVPAPSSSQYLTADRRESGRGLAGISKRAAVFDGTVAYGADIAGRTWETTAIFPLDGDR
jgi:signal transduction histidine kinase